MGLIITGLIIFISAAPIAGFMLWLRQVRKKETARHRAIVETPTTPIAQMQTGGFYELQGRAVASDQGTVVSPLTGRPLLGCFIDIKAAYHGGKNGVQWRQIGKLRDRREFWLDDGSGRRAWITPQDASAILPTTRHGGADVGVVIGGTQETTVAMTPHVAAWAQQQSGEMGRDLTVVESVIAEGEQLYVLGWAYDHNGVMCLRNHPPDHELMLSTLSEAQLVELMGGRAKWRAGLLGCFGGTAVLGLLLLLAGVLVKAL